MNKIVQQSIKLGLMGFALCLLAACGSPTKETTAKTGTTDSAKVREVWSVEKAKDWYKQWGWLRGADFIPSTAINQLEMWQEETFDPKTIDRELGYAEGIGMNSMRVYLHHLAWQVDSVGFKKRMNTYLNLADKHKISTIFVLFDDCWNPTYKAGDQPKPKTGIHNSGWVRDPGDKYFEEPKLVDTLEMYAKDIFKSFANDKRIVLWDVYNEPGNTGHGNKSMPLLQKVFAWGREVNPSQPLSAGVWDMKLKELNDYQVKNSDVTTYHNYGPTEDHQKWIDSLRSVNGGKPLICTEYMARTRNSLFSTIMPMLKRENIGAYNWGLVDGKTNTKYAWDTPMKNGGEPKTWFHDIFHKDGTPYNKEETDLIKGLTGKGK